MMKRLAGLILALSMILSCAAAEHTHGHIEVREDSFVADLHEIWHALEEGESPTVEVEGYVYRYPQGEDENVQFAVLRDYFSEEDGVMPYGVDCYFEGALPDDDAWVRVSGTPVYYEEDGETYMMLMVQSLGLVPDAERGSKLVFG